MSDGLQQVINYMLPAVGTPRGYFWTGVMDADPVSIDFRAINGGGIDGQPFRPSGVFIDNTRGTAPIALIINEISYQIVCLAGELLNVQFPAPVDVSVTWTGFGEVTIVFVDFPVLPYRNLSIEAGTVVWGNISGTLSDQIDLQNALNAKISGVAFQEESAAVVTSATLNVVGDGATLSNVGGVATLTVPGGGGGAGVDYLARAGASRFVVPGTYEDPADAEPVSNRDVFYQVTSGGGNVDSVDIAGMDTVTEYSAFVTINAVALPPGTRKIIEIYNDDFFSSNLYLTISPAGALKINNDDFYTEISSANGVITAGVNHDIAVVMDFTNGGVIKVFVDTVAVITTAGTSDTTPIGNLMGYSLLGDSSTNIKASRLAIFSGLLSDAEVAELSPAGDPQAISPAAATLRAYWKLDEGTGTNAAATVGGNNLTVSNTWGTIAVATELEVGTPVRIASTGATGAFATHENDLAIKTEAAWDFLNPVIGWNVYDQSDLIETQWDGTSWGIIDQAGSFTPTLSFDTPGDLSVAYNFAVGRFDVTGKVVTVHVDISTSTFTHTTASGSLKIGNMPFTPPAGESGVGSLVFQGITKASYTNFVFLAIPSNDATVAASGSGQNTAFVSAADMPTGGTVLLRASVTFNIA